MNDDEWQDAARLDEIEVGGVKLVNASGRKIALFRTGAETVHAVDNLCPHEGYPLSQGYVKDCVLTCAWHNYKFELATGSCIQGDEDVARYDVRLRDGRVELYLATASGAASREQLLASLEAGLFENATGRVARDVVRLLNAGVSPERLLFLAVSWDARRAEYGSTHALPVAADLLGLLERYPGSRAALPIMQVMDLSGEANVRRPERPEATPIDPGSDPAAAGARFRRLLEQEDLEQAEGLLRGALSAGVGRDELERWMLRASTDHFLGFGHSLIYTIKLFDLIDAVGWEDGRGLLPGLLHQMVSATREDTLPPMRVYGEAVARHAPRFAKWRAQPGVAFEREHVVRAVLDGGRREAQEGVAAAFEAGAAPAQVAEALSLAAAERLLRFDPAIDGDHRVQEGWLDVTHTLTFASAVRQALARLPDEDALRLLFQAAHFINRTRPLDLPEGERCALEPAAGDPPEAERVVAAIASKDARGAVSLAAALLAQDGGLDRLGAALEALMLEDPVTRPIVVAHVIKTTRVAFDDARMLSPPSNRTAVFALVRLLASPLKERRVRRAVHEAIRFLDEGKPPKRMT